jgi:hypothetical protein
VSGLAQKKETKRKKPPPPIVKEAEANAKNDKEGNKLPVPSKATGQRAKKSGAPNQNRPPRTTRSSFTANTASVTANDGTTRSSLAVSVGDPVLTKKKPRSKSANQKGSPLSQKNRRRVQARKGDQLEKNDAPVKPDRGARNARQQKTRNTTPKRNATKRSNSATAKGATRSGGTRILNYQRYPTGFDKSDRIQKDDLYNGALDTIDTKLDELTTKIADTILRSADDPVLKRQSQIQQRRILEIKELLKSLKEDSAFVKGGD